MNQLAQHLERNKIRQTDFAKQCGVAQPVVSRLVNGNAQPSPKLAMKIEKITGGAVRFYSWPVFAAFAPSDENAVAGE